MREWLGDLLPGSLLILDEAHHAAPSSGGRYGIETKFTRAVRDLSQRFEHRLFLSATPPQRPLEQLLHAAGVARSLSLHAGREGAQGRLERRDGAPPEGGYPRDPGRLPEAQRAPPGDRRPARRRARTRPVRSVRTSTAPRARSGTRRLRTERGPRPACWLSGSSSGCCPPSKRSPAACGCIGRPWNDTGARGAAGPSPCPGRRRLPQCSPNRLVPTTSAESGATRTWRRRKTRRSRRLTAAADASPAPDEALWAREQALLDRMEKVAEDTRHLPDAKTRRLIDWIREHLCPALPPFGAPASRTPAAWNDRRVLIFTENRQGTKRYLRSILEQAIEGTDRADDRIAVIDGLTGGPRRKAIQRRFNKHPAEDPLRILLATDAAREGLNFQAHCTDLFHFDLPWNPGRIEQRNGRIDRKLQPAPAVNCHYFVLPQRAEDRVLEVPRREDRDDQARTRQPFPGHRRRRGAPPARRHPPPGRGRTQRGHRDGGPRRGEKARHRRGTGSRPRAPGCPRGPDRTLPDAARALARLDGLPARALSRRPVLLPGVTGRPAPDRGQGRPGKPGLVVPAAWPTGRHGPELDLHPGFAARPEGNRPEAARLAPGGADSSGRLQGRRCRHREHGAPAPRTTRRATPARPLPRPGLRLSRPPRGRVSCRPKTRSPASSCSAGSPSMDNGRSDCTRRSCRWPPAGSNRRAGAHRSPPTAGTRRPARSIFWKRP